MAAIDYGVVVKKNGIIINDDLYTPMYNTLGFENKDNSCYPCEYFIYLGDEDFYIGIYKNFIDIYKNKGERIARIRDLYHYSITPQCDTYDDALMRLAQSKYRCKTEINGVLFDIKRLGYGDKYYLRFRYKEDLYEIVYGYGVAFTLAYWEGMDKKLERWLLNVFGIAEGVREYDECY